MMRPSRILFSIALVLALAGCSSPPLATVPQVERDQIEARLMRDIEVLASDEFDGRRPGTAGEVRTVDFLIEKMQQAGFVSGTNDPGSAWRAPVELVSSTPKEGTVTLVAGGQSIEIGEGEASVFTSGRRSLIGSAPLVFVGREAESILAEDVAGKIIVMLSEPGVSPRRRSILFEHDPAGILTVVEDRESIARVNRFYMRERNVLASDEQTRLTGFVTDKVMQDLVGEDQWDLLREAAEDENFVPVPLAAKGSLDAISTRREFTSSNVIGLLPGTVRGSGAVLLLAHWDHLGECAEGTPDPICNGAVDNASGIAVMLELGRRLAASGPFDRDIYLLATTAEESGLLGVRAFAEAPPMPLDSVVAAFNFDTVAVAPAGTPVGFVGEGRTELDGIIREVVSKSGRELGDREYADSFVRRQDGWALLDRGVPAVFLSSAFASEIVLGPYLSRAYHRPGDEVAGIELGGAIDDLLLHEELVRRLASTQDYTPPAQSISAD